MRLIKTMITTGILLLISNLAQASDRSFLKTGNTSKQTLFCQVSPCHDRLFDRPASNICIDTSDSKDYPTSAQVQCVINPGAKNVPKWQQELCDGNWHTYDIGDANYFLLMVSDDKNPPKITMKHMKFQIGICTADIQADNLASFAGKIYSCNPVTGKFQLQ